jgi:hypothetical protein
MDLRWITRGAAAAERMRRRGMAPNGHLLWQLYEENNLRFGHPDYRSIVAVNVSRTLAAHYSKAGRMGITRSRTWVDNDLLKLHRFFPRATRNELEAMFPERTWSAICARAWKDGYTRPTKMPAPTGNFLLDQILSRAIERNISLKELDALACTRRYFSSRGWKRGRFKVEAHVRAVHVLGGRLRARPLDRVAS